ncbi:MAG: hypothetical protein LBH06_05735 [Rikenellaceae bacterium]|jgi:hypothetical protein|nr:hypothetical protein [Rikenellaceae bacterium]
MKKEQDDLRAIREMMERSSKFLSLSGLSGIMAGVAALAGALFAHLYLLRDPSATGFSRFHEWMILLADAVVVLTLAVGSGLWFSWRKARRRGVRLLDRTTLRTLYNLALPLVVGGSFCVVMLLRGEVLLVIAGTLIFYGLALVNVSKYTYGEIHWLGITEIALGLAAAVVGGHGLVFWSLGFGVCHIVYGAIMYLKYDKQREEVDDGQPDR